jgi:hypothetical protein
MEAWKKQSANGYMTISAHDTEAKPHFPDNTLRAALDAKVWTVGDYNADLTSRDRKNNSLWTKPSRRARHTRMRATPRSKRPPFVVIQVGGMPALLVEYERAFAALAKMQLGAARGCLRKWYEEARE